MRIVSYHTPDPLYRRYAGAFRLDMKRLGLSVDDYVLEERPRGAFRRACTREKIFVICDAMEKYREPLLWIDVDSRVWRNPANRSLIDADFAAHRRDGGWSGAVMFFNCTSKGLELLDVMRKVAEANPYCFDEQITTAAVNYVQHLRVAHLPPLWFHRSRRGRDKCVISVRVSKHLWKRSGLPRKHDVHQPKRAFIPWERNP